MKLRLGFFLLLCALCVVTPAGAQDTRKDDAAAAIDLHPLRPPDTSSPRATLRSFQTSIDYAINAWRKGPLDARGIRNRNNFV